MSSLSQALLLKKELDALRPIKKEDELRILQKFRLDWNYHSNHLEGNSLTYGETKALILFGITAQGKPLKDHFEVTGHNEAIEWVIDIVKQGRPLTEKFIREFHKLILKESYKTKAITPGGQPTKKKVKIGEYKSTPNHVETKTGEIFRFATPEETPALMDDLLKWYRKQLENKEVNPILLATQFHYKFIRIHPFDDGNGRLARILMNFILMQFSYPPVIIKTQDKENYFAALRQADAGIFEPFLEYITKNLIHSLEIMIKGAKGGSVEEPDDIDKEVALLEQRLKTISNLAKNREILLKFYDHSVVPLTNKFIEKCKLFDKFYNRTHFVFSIDKNPCRYEDKNDSIIENHNFITNNTSEIGLFYHFVKFNYKGFSEFDFQIRITIDLKNIIKYNIKGAQNHSIITKPYGEQLNKKEINEIVNFEMKRHKALIDAEIERLKND